MIKKKNKYIHTLNSLKEFILLLQDEIKYTEMHQMNA